MADPVTITPVPYGPNEGDDSPADYLQRCGWGLHVAHGYDYAIQVHTENGVTTAQLDLGIPMSGVPGNKRSVTILAPTVVMDMAGDVLTQAEFDAKYGGN